MSSSVDGGKDSRWVASLEDDEAREPGGGDSPPDLSSGAGDEDGRGLFDGGRKWVGLGI